LYGRRGVLPDCDQRLTRRHEAATTQIVERCVGWRRYPALLPNSVHVPLTASGGDDPKLCWRLQLSHLQATFAMCNDSTCRNHAFTLIDHSHGYPFSGLDLGEKMA
jgi:hypothetical protein